jgi:hypothetical protein
VPVVRPTDPRRRVLLGLQRLIGDLPASVKRDLDKAAAGIGRTPTNAHPDCICRKQIGVRPLPRWLWADHDIPEEGPVFGKPDDCPQHKPDP